MGVGVEIDSIEVAIEVEMGISARIGGWVVGRCQQMNNLTEVLRCFFMTGRGKVALKYEERRTLLLVP